MKVKNECLASNVIGNLLSHKKGMTLVEIVIVLGILAAVMALLLPNLTGRQDKANVSETKIHMGQIVQAISMYNSDCHKIPANLEALYKPDSSCTNWGPDPYIKPPRKGQEALSDAWGTPYLFETDGSTFTIHSLGKDRKEGGKDYAADISSDDL